MSSTLPNFPVEEPYHDQKLLQSYHLERAQQILENRLPTPSTIEIDVTDGACNQACIHCCFGNGPHKKLRLLDIDLFLDFARSAFEHGVRAFELVGGAEPTNHPEIVRLVQGLFDLGSATDPVHLGLVTNGVRLDRVFPVIHLLSWVRVSLDSVDPEIYATLHGVSPRAHHLDGVQRNIGSAVSMAEEGKVRIGYLVVPPYNSNRNAIIEAAAWAYDSGVKHIAYRPAFLTPHPPSAEWEEPSLAIREAKERFGRSFVVGGEHGSWRYVLGRVKQPKGRCRTRPLVMVVKADGSLASCILFRERTDERPCLGHISEGFPQSWFSEQNLHQWESIDRQDCPPICKHFRADQTLAMIESGELLAQGPREFLDPYFI